jgi:protoporphyrinogen oxidase
VAQRSAGGTGQVAVVGAGPAGLTAAYELVKRRVPVVVFEADDVVGGISRTVVRDGWRFDIGGHRFFTKVARVEALWHEILPSPEDFVVRPRLSRILYGGRFYAYPIKPVNALANLGPVEATRCVASYAWAKVRPIRHPRTLEEYIVANYGWRLYRHFFETYNLKVWGVPAAELSADWGAQRIKGMSLAQAVWEPLRARVVGRRDRGAQVTSLVEEFHYPRLGPGMMWERCRELVEAGGGHVETSTPVRAVHRGPDGATAVTVGPLGSERSVPVDHVVSSMPLSALVAVMDPPAPPAVVQAAGALHYRDFLTVALVVPEERGFPDNWIYVHDPDVQVGRIQNFGSWSPAMVHQGRTCLGMEYFVFEGDRLWSMPDEALIALATDELVRIGLVRPGDVEAGHVVRVPKAYPVYDEGYQQAVASVAQWLATAVPNVHPVGRNGMHRYNNQDHSMLTAMLTVENIVDGTRHDVWSVNVDQEYHEATVDRAAGRRGAAIPVGSEGGGRDAPIMPRSAAAATAEGGNW